MQTSASYRIHSPLNLVSKTQSPASPSLADSKSITSTGVGYLQYRPDIDGLRAVAILMVVIYHAFPSLLTGGFIGVDVFFVISGFLISTIIYKQLTVDSFSFLQFYVRRIKRIFPALFIVLLFCFAFGWFNLLADEFAQLGKHIAGGAGFVANLVLWSESGYFDNAADTKSLLHLWSLGIEEQFYFVWPIIIFLAWKKRVNLLKVGCFIGLVSFVANVYEVHRVANFTTAFYSPITRFWELMVGAILAYMMLNQKGLVDRYPGGAFKALHRLVGNNGISIVGVMCLLVGALLITKESAFPGFLALLPAMGAALLIVAGEGAWVNRMVLSNRLMVWIGLISFPLYLWHWPLLSFAHILQGQMPEAEIRILIVLASIALSTLTYYLLEKPIRANRFNKTKAIILVFLLMMVGYVGLNTYQRDGLTFRLAQVRFRLPPVLQTLAMKNPSASDTAIGPLKVDCTLPDAVKMKSEGAVCYTQEELQKPKILLWGDSYAGHLLAGYEERYGSQYQIMRVGHNGCPPILDMELPNRKNCTAGNADIVRRFLRDRPAKLVIAANWTDYDWRRVEGTLIQLQQSGFTSIDLIGPAPVWSDGLYKQLYLKYLSDRDPNIPYRMSFGFNKDKDFLGIDADMAKMAAKLKVHYLSIVNILCNADGCITRFGDTGDTLESYDAGHFTNMASRYVVSRFPGK